MNRRGFLAGLLAAPVVIRTPGLLMPIRPALFDPEYVYTFGGRPFFVGDLAKELSAITRRALVSSDYVDMYRTHPLLGAMLDG